MKIRDAGAVPLWIPVAGRILFAVYFILMGSSHLVKFREHSALLGRKRVPFPAAATILAIIMMVGGGVLVLFDWHKSVGAALLFGIIFPAPFFLFHFWNETESYSWPSEFAHFIQGSVACGSRITVALLSINKYVFD